MSRIKCANCGSEADSRGATFADLIERLSDAETTCAALARECKQLEEDREYNARLIEERTLAVTCPNCDDLAVPIPLADLSGLHCGMTVICPICGEDIVFGTFTADEYGRLAKFFETFSAERKETHGLHTLDCNGYTAAAR